MSFGSRLRVFMDAPSPSPTSADHVIGVFTRDGLSTALAATHRAGFGPYTRVLDGTRSSTSGQLERLGLRVVQGEAPAGDAILIVVNSPGRTGLVAELFAQLGAAQTVFAARRANSVPVQRRLDELSPDVRIGSGTDTAPAD
jgi:hypothetical protein